MNLNTILTALLLVGVAQLLADLSAINPRKSNPGFLQVERNWREFLNSLNEHEQHCQRGMPRCHSIGIGLAARPERDDVFERRTAAHIANCRRYELWHQ